MFGYSVRLQLFHIISLLSKVRRKLKAKFFTMLTGYDFEMVGRNFKFKVRPYIKKNNGWPKWGSMRIGDNCWIEAVYDYAGEKFEPCLHIGERLCASDNVHISCVSSLILENDILIGSKVYIGDHSHGSYKTGCSGLAPPANKMLGDIAPIKIGSCCWIGDNAVILAGSEICGGCVIAANAVVKDLKVDKPCLIGGVPAKVLKVF
ncbi:transferase [Citrobacter cronae]|uniref:Acetyltransferase n=2 Tax=Citrobacter werkmanii TaxID=67827 RepID=A0A2Z4C1T2_9ENTR|nr:MULTISPECIES: transferase [Citrobacter]MBS6073714.1 transferase [Citrobacter freundii]AWU66739.1 acetyltransferase [Citrobacter werkmanii]MBY6247930.1 transferase [Citrobacter werkmanii]MBY6252229.1 transferase [Citrobacter werkmanii]MDM3302230.1 transferase [Citrobacter sp. Cc227]